MAPEHVRRMLRFSITKQWKMLLTAFREADVHKTGELTPQVLRDVLERFNIDMGDALFKHVIEACDEDKDGSESAKPGSAFEFGLTSMECVCSGVGWRVHEEHKKSDFRGRCLRTRKLNCSYCTYKAYITMLYAAASTAAPDSTAAAPTAVCCLGT